MPSVQEKLDELKQRAIADLEASIFGRAGEFLSRAESREGIQPGPGGVPVRVVIPTVRELLPAAAVVAVVLLAPVLLDVFGKRRRRRR